MKTRYWLVPLWIACCYLTGCIRTANVDLIYEYKQCMNAGMEAQAVRNDWGVSGYQCVPPQTTKAPTVPR